MIFFLLISLTQNLPLKPEQLEDSILTYSEVQQEEFQSNQKNGSHFINVIEDQIMNFSYPNRQLGVQSAGSINQTMQENSYLQWILLNNFLDKNQLSSSQQDTEIKYDPQDFVFQNIFYCSIISFLMLVSIILIQLFVSEFKCSEISGLALILSIGQQWWILGILGLAFDFSNFEGMSYFITALSITAINFCFSIKLLIALKNYVSFRKESFINIFFIWIGFSIAAIYIIWTSQLDNLSSQYHYQFALKSYLFCQLLPLFEQIRETLYNGINTKIKEIKDKQEYYFFYVLFLSLPSIYSINFQTYYYAVFLYKPDYYLLTVFLVLFTFCLIIIHFQHFYGPVFENPKTIHFPWLEKKQRRTESFNEMPGAREKKDEQSQNFCAGPN